MHSHVWNSGSWRRGLWGDRTAFPLGPTSICWSIQTTQHWTAQTQEWDWGGGKTSRGALKPSQTLRALWPISRRVQGNGLNLHLHLHLYLHEKWETSPQKQGNLTCGKVPPWNLGSAPRTLDTLLAGSVLEPGPVMSFTLLPDLPFTFSSLFTFILLFLLLLEGRGKIYHFPCWVCSLL